MVVTGEVAHVWGRWTRVWVKLSGDLSGTERSLSLSVDWRVCRTHHNAVTKARSIAKANSGICMMFASVVTHVESFTQIGF